MKSPEALIAQIREMIGRYLDRPHMYTPNPESFEQSLLELTSICEFLIDPQRQDIYPANSNYFRYMQTMERFGVLDFTRRARVDGTYGSDEELYQALTQFWREFLATQEWWTTPEAPEPGES